MKSLLYSFFLELGLIDIAKGMAETNHRFGLNIYSNIFEREITQPDLIISEERRQEMKKLYLKELEKNESKH